MSGVIDSFELAFRMQAETPKLVDLSGESADTLKLYGIEEDAFAVRLLASSGLAFFIALASAGSLQAQTVWRCGEGGTLYSDRACADGRPVTVADARSSTEVACKASGAFLSLVP